MTIDKNLDLAALTNSQSGDLLEYITRIVENEVRGQECNISHLPVHDHGAFLFRQVLKSLGINPEIKMCSRHVEYEDEMNAQAFIVLERMYALSFHGHTWFNSFQVIDDSAGNYDLLAWKDRLDRAAPSEIPFDDLVLRRVCTWEYTSEQDMKEVYAHYHANFEQGSIYWNGLTQRVIAHVEQSILTREVRAVNARAGAGLRL